MFLSSGRQYERESSYFPFAPRAITPATPRPTTPAPPTTSPSVRRLLPDVDASTPAEGTAGASTATGASSSAGILTTTLAFSPSTRTVVCQVFFPGADTSTRWDPGSTGIAVPHSARP